MKFEEGHGVVIARNLGVNSGRARSEYYHGGSLEDVPLGAKATVVSVLSADKIYLSLENGRNENSGRWYVHPDELRASDEQIEAEKVQQARVDSLLEDVLSAGDPVLEEEPVGIAGKVSEPEKPKRLFWRIAEFFGYKNRGEGNQSKGNPFDPAFNVREEFAVWVRQEFPELKAYVGNNKTYPALIKREKEVYKAAEMACKHGMKTAQSCVSDSFDRILKDISHYYSSNQNYEFANSVVKLVNWIEKVSVNLNSGALHYGTSYYKDGRRISAGRT